MERQTVVERKIRLDGSIDDLTCQRIVIEPDRHAILRYVLERDWPIRNRVAGERIPVTSLPLGTTTIAHYWTDRPYNVYHWLDPNGRTIGLYFNVADQTVIADQMVAYRDLAVDVLLQPSGAIDILDEDEVPPDLEPAARKTIAQALEALITNGRRLAAEIEQETSRHI